jgi:hypothetical protein
MHLGLADKLIVTAIAVLPLVLILAIAGFAIYGAWHWLKQRGERLT